MKKFFFDTANVDFIKKTWNTIKSDVDPSHVRGITTNPNAFFKLNKLHLNEWLYTLKELCDIMSSIRSDGNGIVYIQCPSSTMSNDQIDKYINLIKNNTNGHSKVGLKIPPYKNILKYIKYFYMDKVIDLNVTGLADCSTALKCLQYPVKYISVIPGRMEEAGINAKEQVAYIQNSKDCPWQEIIAGSMRTIEGLSWTIQYDTVPTIGEKVWNLILENNNLNKLQSIIVNIAPMSEFSPNVTDTNKKLSVDFFNQMDKCGEIAYNDYKELI